MIQKSFSKRNYNLVKKQTLFVVFFFGSFFALASAHESVDRFSESRLNVVPKEIYIAVYPLSGAINIIEYDLKIVGSRDGSISTEVDRIKSEIRRGAFATQRYKFRDSWLGEEKVYLDNERDIVIGKYWLKTENKNLQLFEDVFEVFLKQDVQITYDRKQLSARYKQNGITAVASENGQRYRNETDEMIVWKDESPNYDVVFSIDRSHLALHSIEKHFESGERIASPGVYVDGTTVETYLSSIGLMTKDAYPESARKFQVALIKISRDLVTDNSYESADDARRVSYELMADKLDSMSFEEIIALGNSIKPSNETERVIKDFEKTGTSSDFQHDADLVRLRHVTYLAELIERFHDKTGFYPLSSEKQRYLFFVSPSQEQYAVGNQSYSKERNPIEEFKNQLESKLEHEVVIPFDPQLVPVNKPNFYVYRADGSGYSLTAHLFNGKNIGRKVRNFYYELSISNQSDKHRGIYTLDEIKNTKRFKKMMNAEFRVAPPKNPEQVGLVVIRPPKA